MRKNRWQLAVSAVFLSVVTTGCATGANQALTPAEFTRASSERAELQQLPMPKSKVLVAVYDFVDETGQHKPNERFAEYSRAVTQGGYSYLLHALQSAGNGSWFTPLERRNFNNILQERNIIDSTRDRYNSSNGGNLPPVGPLSYAGVIIDGSIVSYETNTATGGLGARLLGIGASTEYRNDVVTVALRLVNVQTSQVMLTVTAHKSIFSVGLQADVFRFIDADEILEIEAGITSNEPRQLAVRRAIEKAVIALIFEGALKKVWGFKDETEAEPLLDQYLAQSAQIVSRQAEVVAAEAAAARKGNASAGRTRQQVQLR